MTANTPIPRPTRAVLALPLLLAGLLAGLAAPRHAQAQAPTEFPVAAETLDGDVLRDRLTRHVLYADAHNNDRWRLLFKSGGYYFLDIEPGGRRTSGQWTVQGSRVCLQERADVPRCHEVRVRGDIVFIQFGPRLNNEVLLFLDD